MKRLVRDLLCCFALWCAVAVVWADYALKIVPLRHRLADQVLPILQPLVEPGGVISAYEGKLFIRTSPQNFRDLQAVLEQIDIPAKKLLISVRHGSSLSESRRSVAVAGRIGTRSSDVDVRLGDIHQRSRDDAQQQIQAIEGAEVLVRTGTAVPVPVQQRIVRPNGVVVRNSSTQYVEASSGFYARAQLAGERVNIEISPQQQKLSAQGIQSSNLNTQVSGRLGEWIPLGGSSISRSESNHGILSSERNRSNDDTEVWLKVEVIE